MIETNESYQIDYIDQSSLSTFSRCPARYLFDRLLGLRLPDAVSIAADFGIDMHRAIPFCYAGLDGIDKAYSVFDDCWAKRPYGNTDTKRNPERAHLSLHNFCITHTPNLCPYKIVHYPIKAVTADAISDNEIPFAIDIDGPLPALGRIDAPVIWNSTNTQWALDYKTSQEISGRYFTNFEMSPQGCLYTLALSSISNTHIEGIIIEAIRVSDARVETQLAFIFCSDVIISLFLELAKRKSEEILVCNTTKKWPQNTCACSSYPMFGYPSGSCEYKMICQSKDWLDTTRYYSKQEPFHPFKVR